MFESGGERPAWVPPLPVALVCLLSLVWLAGIQLPLFFGSFPHTPRDVDFANYYAGAQVGLRHGWNHVYDTDLQRGFFRAATGKADFDWRVFYVSPPPLAWLVAPLTVLPFTFAFWIWVGVSALALGIAVWLVTPGSVVIRVVVLAVGAGLYPVLVALQSGQITPLIAAGMGVSWWFLDRNRPVLAAMLLLPVVLKPQVGILIPLALFLAGYRATFFAWLAVAASLGAVAVASLGTHGVTSWLSDLAAEQGHLENQVWTIAVLVRTGPHVLILEIAAGAVALIAAWRSRGQGAAVATVAGYLGSLLATGYHHSIDYPGLLPAALISAALVPRRWLYPIGCLGVACCLATPRAGPGPLLVFQIAWLLICIRPSGVASTVFPSRRQSVLLGPPA